MSIKEQIQKDLNQALKAKKEVEVLVLRMLNNAIKNAEIVKKREELTKEDIIKIIRSEIKKRQEAIQDFKKGGRDDLVAKETAEIEVLKKYLPQELDEVEAKKIISQAIKKTGAAGPKDFGKVMGVVMKEIAGRMEGSRVKDLVTEELKKLESHEVSEP